MKQDECPNSHSQFEDMLNNLDEPLSSDNANSLKGHECQMLRLTIGEKQVRPHRGIIFQLSLKLIE